jgi:hypothetical protein
MAIRTTAQDDAAEKQPWCDHREAGTETTCHKAGIAVGVPGPDGRAPYVCTAGHHFFWPHEGASLQPAPTAKS